MKDYRVPFVALGLILATIGVLLFFPSGEENNAIVADGELDENIEKSRSTRTEPDRTPGQFPGAELGTGPKASEDAPGATPEMPSTSTSDPTRPSSPPKGNFNLAFWDFEGSDPRSGDDLIFDALREQVETENGNGWRHEGKIKESLRVSMAESYEDFTASVTADLSDGSKTIVAQYHASNTDTLVKVYISDTSESGFDDSMARNGVFDVFVRMRPSDADDEDKYALGTIRSGGSFDLQVLNDKGTVTVSALGRDFSRKVADSSGSYLKVGNYHQAQDPDSLDDVDDPDDWPGFYRDAGITTSQITFSDVNHVREVG